MKLDMLQVQRGFFGREVGALQWVEQMKEQENTWLYHEVEDGVEISDGEAQKLATDHGKLCERGTHQELLEQRESMRNCMRHRRNIIGRNQEM